MKSDAGRLPKAAYEKELFRLQAELVKLQEWVRVEGARLVVVFEGRDAAGKGSAIKRVAEYLNPRVARIVALPAPTEREQTQWYFQRYVEHLPAAGEIVAVRPQLVQPGRRRAGDGVLHRGGVPPVPAPVPDLRAAARRGRHPAAQVLVLGQRRRAGAAVPVPAGRPDAALEALPDGPGVDQPLGGLLAGQGRDVRPHRPAGDAVVRRGQRRQAPFAAQHDRASAVHGAVLRGAAAAAAAAAAAGVQRLSPPAAARAQPRAGPRRASCSSGRLARAEGYFDPSCGACRRPTMGS